MKTLRECILDAQKNKVAIGHFNISNIEGLWGVFNAAKNLNLPVIIGVSEGERDFIGVSQVVALVKSLREKYNFPIFLNADHTYSFDRLKEAVDAGFDSVIFDGAELSFDENVNITRQCVDYAKRVNPEIIIEGELGFIGKSSKVLDSIPSGVKITEEYLTKPEDAKKFVEMTEVDLLAPAVGNIHGMLKGGVDPALNISLINKIYTDSKIPLVLHGGSGNSDNDFVKAIDAGVAIIHVSTELRVAYKNALRLSLQENPDECAPYKILKPAVQAIEKVVEQKLKVFNKLI